MKVSLSSACKSVLLVIVLSRSVASDAQSCNLARQSWSSRYRSISTNISTYNEEGTTYITPEDASVYTTLCDGLPRAHGTAIWSYVTNISSYTLPVTTVSHDAPPAPCSLACSDCSTLWATWFQNMSAIRPACATDAYLSGCNAAGSISCNPSTLYNDGATSGPTCVFGGGPVQLAYWPITTKPGNLSTLCNGDQITMAGNDSTYRSAVAFNTTITSPSMYVYFSTLYAVDGCGGTVGTPLSDYLLPVQSKDVSTACGWYHAGLGPAGPLNFADLNSPVPWSAYSCMPQCGVGGGGATDYCSTMYDDYLPQLAFPEVVTDIQSDWKSCGFSIYGNLLYDPPIALTPASTIAEATIMYDPVTSTAASPSLSATTIPTKTSDSDLGSAAVTTAPQSASPTAATAIDSVDPAPSTAYPEIATTLETSSGLNTVVGTSAETQLGSSSNIVAPTESALNSPIADLPSMNAGTNSDITSTMIVQKSETETSFVLVTRTATSLGAKPSETDFPNIATVRSSFTASPASRTTSQAFKSWATASDTQLKSSDIAHPTSDGVVSTITSTRTGTGASSGSAVTYVTTYFKHTTPKWSAKSSYSDEGLPSVTVVTTVVSVSTFTLSVPVERPSSSTATTSSSEGATVTAGCVVWACWTLLGALVYNLVFVG